MSDEERNSPPPADDNENADDVAPKSEDPNAPINVKVGVVFLAQLSSLYNWLIYV